MRLSNFPYDHWHSIFQTRDAIPQVAYEAQVTSAGMTMSGGESRDAVLDRVTDALCFALQALDEQGLVKPALYVSLAIDLLQNARSGEEPIVN